MQWELWDAWTKLLKLGRHTVMSQLQQHGNIQLLLSHHKLKWANGIGQNCETKSSAEFVWPSTATVENVSLGKYVYLTTDLTLGYNMQAWQTLKSLTNLLITFAYFESKHTDHIVTELLAPFQVFNQEKFWTRVTKYKKIH